MNKPQMIQMAALVGAGERVTYRAVGNIVMTAVENEGRYFLVRGETVMDSTPTADLVVSEVLERAMTAL